MKRFILLLTITLLFAACDIFEPYDKIYYHDVEGEGYVYYEDKPVSNIDIRVYNNFRSKGYATKAPIHENFRSDANGYFRVRFIRRTGHEDVISYDIFISNDTLQDNHYHVPLSPTEIRNSNGNIQLGIFYYKGI